jgi:hypothetical protein
MTPSVNEPAAGPPQDGFSPLGGQRLSVGVN